MFVFFFSLNLIIICISQPWIFHISFLSFRYSLARFWSSLCVATCPIQSFSLQSTLIFTLLLEIVYLFISVQMTHFYRPILDSMAFTKQEVKHFIISIWIHEILQQVWITLALDQCFLIGARMARGLVTKEHTGVW